MRNGICKTAKRIGLLLTLLAALTGFAAAAEVTGNEWIFPVTDYTSYGTHHYDCCDGHGGKHYGHDIPAAKWTMIVATKSGTVYKAHNACTKTHMNSNCACKGAGNHVVIKHSSKEYTEYFHMTKSAVKVGDWVEQGDIIGYVGTTGWSDGNHLHFEYRTGTSQSSATAKVDTIVSSTASKNGTGDQFGPSLRKTTVKTNLLVKPNKDSTVVTVIPAGTEVLCTIVQEHWGFVKYNGMKGWVNMKTNTEQVEKAFQIDYYSSGGSGKMSNTTVVLADEMQHSANKFTKSGYYHNGWWVYLSKSNKFLYTNGTDYAWYVKGTEDAGWSRVVFRDKEPIDGKALASLDNKQLITLWSYWKEGTPADFTIKFHANGGTGTMADMAARRGAKNVFPLCTFENPGYRFVGWRAYRESDEKWQYVLENGSYQWHLPGTEPEGAVLRAYKDGEWTNNTTAVDGDVVHLYAQWEEEPGAGNDWVEKVSIYFNTMNIEPGTGYWNSYSWIGGADDVDVIWSSSDESVVTVDKYGNVTALKEGTATITVTADDGGGASDTCRVTVSNGCYESAHPYQEGDAAWIIREEGAKELSVTFDSRTCFGGEDWHCVLLYDGNDEMIGEYTGAQLANKTITVQGDTIKMEILGCFDAWGFAITEINSVPGEDEEDTQVGGLNIWYDTVNMQTSAKFWLPSSWEGEEDAAFTWSSSDESVAAVDESGFVTALQEGTATITVTAADGSGASDSCLIVVEDYFIPESSHPYAGRTYDAWVLREEGCRYIEMTFNEETYVEEDVDFIDIYDGMGDMVGSYTGSELADEVVRVMGDTVVIELISSSESGGWGFAINRIDFPGKVSVAGTSMTLGNELKMNFMIEKTEIPEGCIAMVSQNGGEAVEVEVASYNDTYYAASYCVAAKEMTDLLSVEFYDANGYPVSYSHTKSIKEYATAMMEATSNAKLKALLVDMLNYGAEAQKYFGYSADDLANADLTEEQQALATGGVDVADYRVKGTNYAGTVLSLEESIMLGAVFNGITNSDVAGMTATVEFTNYRGNVIEGDCAVTAHNATRARVTVNQIVLADSRSVVTVKLYKDGELVGECADSVESYAARSLAAGMETTRLNDAIMKFATSAKAYLLK